MKFLIQFAKGLVIFSVIFSLFSYFRDRRSNPQGQLDFQIETLQGVSFSTKEAKRPMVLVFWATWCPPCKVELARIQGMVDRKSISAESVLAISISEEKDLVAKVIGERGYSFPVAVDVDGSIAKQYAVASTPTIALKNSDGSLDWVSSGLSPSLEIRLMKFLNKD